MTETLGTIIVAHFDVRHRGFNYVFERITKFCDSNCKKEVEDRFHFETDLWCEWYDYILTKFLFSTNTSLHFYVH